MRQCPPALFLALAGAFGLGGCGGEARQAPAVSPVDDVRSPTLATVGARVLHDPALEDGTVLVRDGLVTALGPAGAIDLSDDATVVDRAREIDLRVTGNIPVTVDPTAAVRAGHASIEHFVTLFEGTLSEYAAGPEALRDYMETGLDTLVDATDGFFDPTAYTFHVRARRGGCGSHREACDHPGRVEAPHELLGRLLLEVSGTTTRYREWARGARERVAEA